MNDIENQENGRPKVNTECQWPVYVDEGIARVPGHGLESYGVQNQAPNRESKLGEILAKMKDPDVPAAEVTRLIAVELALIIQDMQNCESGAAGALRLRSCMGQVRALGAMVEAAKDDDSWANRDVLDFDGPRFQYVLGELVEGFENAAQQALGGNTTTVKSIMTHFRDILANHDDELRLYCKRGDLQRPETSPAGQSARVAAAANNAIDNPTSHYRDGSDRGEPECDTEPFKNLIESPEDLRTFKTVQESINREPIVAHDVAPPPDLRTKSNRATPPEPREGDI